MRTDTGVARPLLVTWTVTQMRLKIIVMSLLVAFAAPWGVICLADASGHRMPCCPSSQTGPVARPCCAMDADRTGAVTAAASPVMAPAQPLGAFVPLLETGRFRCDARCARAGHPIEIRLLTSVYLI
jgi:hypothetical protein